MSQADSARVEALEAQLKEHEERIGELEEAVADLEAQAAALRKLAEGDDLMPAVYPENTAPKPGRRSG